VDTTDGTLAAGMFPPDGLLLTTESVVNIGTAVAGSASPVVAAAAAGVASAAGTACPSSAKKRDASVPTVRFEPSAIADESVRMSVPALTAVPPV
jgi:roadblock/LC7 domain-containing protein